MIVIDNDVLAPHSRLVVRTPLLLRELWGPGRSGDTAGLRVCMRNLRQKLEPDPARPRYLLTEVGLGFRLRTDVEGAPLGAMVATLLKDQVVATRPTLDSRSPAYGCSPEGPGAAFRPARRMAKSAVVTVPLPLRSASAAVVLAEAL